MNCVSAKCRKNIEINFNVRKKWLYLCDWLVNVCQKCVAWYSLRRVSPTLHHHHHHNGNDKINWNVWVYFSIFIRHRSVLCVPGCSHLPKNLSFSMLMHECCETTWNSPLKATTEKNSHAHYTLTVSFYHFSFGEGSEIVSTQFINVCLFVCSIFYGFVLRVRQRPLSDPGYTSLYINIFSPLFGSLLCARIFSFSLPTISHTL